MRFLSRFLICSGLTVAALVSTSLPAATATDEVTHAENSTVVKEQLAQFQDGRARITVLPLEHGDISADRWWWRNYYRGEGAARGITELLVNEIVNDGTYSVLDGSQFSADENAALAEAEANDLDAVLMGTITRFDLQDNSQCVRVPFRERVCQTKTKAVVQLSVRLVDPISKTVLATAQGEGDASSESFDVNAYSSRVPDVNSDEQRAVDEILSEATEEAIEQIVPEIADAEGNF